MKGKSFFPFWSFRFLPLTQINLVGGGTTFQYPFRPLWIMVSEDHSNSMGIRPLSVFALTFVPTHTYRIFTNNLLKDPEYVSLGRGVRPGEWMRAGGQGLAQEQRLAWRAKNG